MDESTENYVRYLNALLKMVDDFEALHGETYALLMLLQFLAKRELYRIGMRRKVGDALLEEAGFEM